MAKKKPAKPAKPAKLAEDGLPHEEMRSVRYRGMWVGVPDSWIVQLILAHLVYGDAQGYYQWRSVSLAAAAKDLSERLHKAFPPEFFSTSVAGDTIFVHAHVRGYAKKLPTSESGRHLGWPVVCEYAGSLRALRAAQQRL